MLRYKFRPFIIILIILSGAYLLWAQRPVNIIRASIRFEYDPRFMHGLYAGSQRGFTDEGDYDIAVDHMPLTQWGRIHWYLDHKALLKAKYHVPGTSSYHIVFWWIGDGFIDGEKSGDGDLMCFTRIDSNENCLEKNLMLAVDYKAGSQEEFTFEGGRGYWALAENGRPKWYKREY